ncbi:InlB B-repeat-containing protein [Candidatus Saccharibacteria bacterium]|nr:InlB B-repeat-containing protein [Candidatus Saccharibacteria bacterium]
MNKVKRNVVFLTTGAMVALALTVLSSQLLVSSRTFADTTVASQASVTVSSACQLDSVVNTAHEANVTANTYRSGIGETTITATCNDANGYAVYAVGYTNTEFGRNDMLGSTTGRTIATGTATSGNTSNWAMMLTAVSGNVAPTITTGYNAYHAVPDEFTKVASYSSSTMTEPTGSQFKTTYATFVSSVQVPDTYIGKVKYTLVHPADTTNSPCVGNYTINYNSNGGSGNMDSQTACVDRAISLLPDGFTPPTPVSDYQFVNWNTAADGSGYTYVAEQSVTNIASLGGSVTLYAQWAPKYIQDLTSTTCQAIASENPLRVYDKRDGNDYTVRYLQGACWMTQNLRITGVVNALNSNFSTYSNVNVCEGDLTDGNSYDQPRCHDSGNTTNGVWYNYAAASAKTILTSSNDALATEDICPAGWHLPSYDTTSPAGSINSLTGLSSVELTAFSPVAGGFYVNGSLNSIGYGYWWSTTAIGTGSRYFLYYTGYSLSIADNYRGYGRYIRCTR